MHLIFVQRHLLSKELFVCVALGKFQNQDICAYSSSQSEPIRDLHNDGLWWDVTFQFNKNTQPAIMSTDNLRIQD